MPWSDLFVVLLHSYCPFHPFPFLPYGSSILSAASVSALEVMEGGAQTVGLDTEIKHLNSCSRTIGSLARFSEVRFPARTKFG